MSGQNLGRHRQYSSLGANRVLSFCPFLRPWELEVSQETFICMSEIFAYFWGAEMRRNRVHLFWQKAATIWIGCVG